MYKIKTVIKRRPERERSATIVSHGKLYKLNLNRSFCHFSRHEGNSYFGGIQVLYCEYYSDFPRLLGESQVSRASLLRMFNETYSYATRVREASSFFHGLHVKRSASDIQIFTNTPRASFRIARVVSAVQRKKSVREMRHLRNAHAWETGNF